MADALLEALIRIVRLLSPLAEATAAAVLPLDPSRFALAGHALSMALLLLVPYLAAFWGLLALALLGDLAGRLLRDPRPSRLAAEALASAPLRLGTGLLLGLLPLVSIALCEAVVHPGARGILSAFRLVAAAHLLAALLLVRLYAATFGGGAGAGRPRLAALADAVPGIVFGAAAAALALGAVHHHAVASALARTPERWPVFFANPHQTLFAWGAVGGVGPVLAAGIAFAGLLLHARRPAAVAAEGDAAYEAFAGPASLGATLAGALALPPVLLFFVVQIGPPALSAAVLAAAAGCLLAHYLAARRAADRLLAGAAGVGTTPPAALPTVLPVIVLGLALLAATDRLSAAAATEDSVRIGALRAEARRLDAMERREARVAAVAPPSGERIYTERCAACHLFDRALVGPAYDDVVPKYRGDPAAFRRFIAAPTRVDPAFPPMPDPGLRPDEVEAVAAFLLERAAGGTPREARR